MMVSDTVLMRPSVQVFDFVLNTVVLLSRNCIKMSVYFSVVRVFVCTVYFAELAGNYFVTLRHVGMAHARRWNMLKNYGIVL